MKGVVFHFLVAANLLRFPYPNVNRNEKYFDEYHGVKVVDPYRWLEQLDSLSTKKFVKAQRKFTNEFLTSIPERSEIRETLAELWDYPYHGSPVKRGNRYFYNENTGLQNQNVIYMKEGLTAEAEVFFDPNLLSEDGSVEIGDPKLSQDGEQFAYTLSKGGTDWKTVHFKQVATKEDYADILEYTKWPDISWTHDNLGVFYIRYPLKEGQPQSMNSKVYYHRLNTTQDKDILIAEFTLNPKWSLGVDVSDCGKYLMVTTEENFQANSVHIASLEDNPLDRNFKNNFVAIFPSVDEARYTYVSNINTTFIFQTNKNAENGKVILVDLEDHLKEFSNGNSIARKLNGNYSTIEVIPEEKLKVLSRASLVNQEYLLLVYIDEVKNSLELVNLKNTTHRTMFPLPPGTISSLSGAKKNSTEIFFRHSSYISPGTIYKCDLSAGQFDCEIYKETKVKNLDLNSFEVKQVYYPSKDSTAVPMYIVHKKGMIQDGSAPVQLTGYGGFNTNSLPSFSITALFFVEYFGGIVATANIRGGGEYGEKWHEDGSRLKKQNTFDDFQAAAEYLIFENYTNPERLAIDGSSNGGLLVGVCVNQRPELYGAAVADVGVMDMLRFQKFTGGYAWCPEYGCSDNKEDFENLRKYSPLHNIKMPSDETVQYPAVLVTTAENDDRVVPSHSYKYIAELQHRIGRHPRQKKPLLLRVESKAGHGGGASTAKAIDEAADVASFLKESMGLRFRRRTPK